MIIRRWFVLYGNFIRQHDRSYICARYKPSLCFKQYLDKNVHQRSGYTLALSRSSDRISKYEYMSGQNKKPWFQGDGAFYLYFTGADHNEEYGYQYIAAVDPYRYPGTTVPVEIRKTVKELYGKDWYENPEHESILLQVRFLKMIMFIFRLAQIRILAVRF